MSFTVALLIIVALAAVALGLVCYHLLNRLDLVERSVLGGLEPPARRLTREEFEQRFSRAVARHRLATQVESGLVLVLGAESTTGEIAGALRNLQRGDGIILIAAHDTATSFIESLELAELRVLSFDPALGVALTPYALIVDEGRIRSAKATPSGSDLITLLGSHT